MNQGFGNEDLVDEVLCSRFCGGRLIWQPPPPTTTIVSILTPSTIAYITTTPPLQYSPLLPPTSTSTATAVSMGLSLVHSDVATVKLLSLPPFNSIQQETTVGDASTVCEGSLFANNSTYSENLNSLFSSLASNVTANDGFYNTSTGEGTNKVYGLALCRRGYEKQACVNCVEQASQEKQRRHLVEFVYVFSWNNSCNTLDCPRHRYPFSEGYYNSCLFGRTLKQIVKAANLPITARTAKTSTLFSYLASNVTANDGFYNTSTGEGTNKVYGLALCGRGYEKQACVNCVEQAIQESQQICPNRMKSFRWTTRDIDNASCLVRYANHSVYETRAFPAYLVTKSLKHRGA
ncbi:hypothetical protein Bca52824_001813 [Brassica carinata]|uniref:Gnk2-homologous domain-containing protein n=1 Tax=Brassica carinata TaxID=52824 RepID=A0A8X7WGT9_BRACI|nr:hypothetical protein Bca52824_001813 [Brassica carinata]